MHIKILKFWISSAEIGPLQQIVSVNTSTTSDGSTRQVQQTGLGNSTKNPQNKSLYY